MRHFKYGVVGICTIGLISGVVVCLWLAGARTLTANESVFLGVFVSLLSILATWLVSHIYAELTVQDAKRNEKENLRMYALKAAEKVTTISNELGKLAGYLQSELDETSYENLQADLQGKNERIQSAIHIIGLLKSVNDGSLSDWQGVIGEELDLKRARDREREEELEELWVKMGELGGAIDGTHDVKSEVQRMRVEMRRLAAKMGGQGLLPSPKNAVEKRINKLPCPKCGHEVSWKQRARKGSFKAIECLSCSANLVASFNADTDTFMLFARAITTEPTHCPYCNGPNQATIDNFPTSCARLNCSTCGRQYRIARGVDGINIQKVAGEAAKPALTSPAAGNGEQTPVITS